CRIGSAGPQKTNPTPIPAANSIPIQENQLNSGSSSSFPSLIFPKGLIAREMTNKTKNAATSIYNQPNRSIIQLSALFAATSSVPGAVMPHATNIATIIADIYNTTENLFEFVSSVSDIMFPPYNLFVYLL